MRNQSMEIPDEFRQAWDEATEELGQASIELQLAQARYHEAVLARIAVTRMINESHETDN